MRSKKSCVVHAACVAVAALLQREAAKVAAQRLRSRAIDAEVAQCDGMIVVRITTDLEGFFSIALTTEQTQGASAIFSMIAARLLSVAKKGNATRTT